ncbi:MAG: 16S rRNA (guanine(966)-N(2))-methyltransferase RsmD [Holosporales bacterium]|jgi:16S rRNA (guanine966-N2)-methyltransferase|nr:16S rRNA (guanine(966)-N(2))-methyltransferase RsmD [Holosporales bacterium]
MLKIIAGRHKGRSLQAQIGNPSLRPTLGRVRQIMFDLLGPFYFQTAPRVLDGFAGTGALGLEALSRGAAHVTFIEKDLASAKLLQETLVKWQEEAHASVITGDFFAHLKTQDPSDLILLDPPYQEGMQKRIFTALTRISLVTPKTLVVLEMARDNDCVSLPSGWQLLKYRVSGPAQILMLQKNISTNTPQL